MIKRKKYFGQHVDDRSAKFLENDRGNKKQKCITTTKKLIFFLNGEENIKK